MKDLAKCYTVISEGKVIRQGLQQLGRSPQWLAEELRRQYDTALIGSVQEVLFEQTEDGFFTGHAKNYVKVYARGDGLHNVVKQVRITALRNDGIEGELLP